MQILISNDDGWDAPGISCMLKVASDFGDCTIVAPATEQSGVSHQQTLGRRLELIKRNDHVWSLDGTPADCIRIALAQNDIIAAGRGFDLVLSGVNNGGNLGSDVYVSGTVAAAREAALYGLPAIAISQHRLHYGQPFDWAQSKSLVRRVISHCIQQGFTARECVNVNLPDVPDAALHSGIEIVDPCSLDPAPRHGQYKAEELAGKFHIHFSGTYNQRNQTPGCDVHACFDKKIPITRMQF